MEEQRGEVLEDDPRLREVRDIPDVVAKLDGRRRSPLRK
jgi:hypothetical protein